MLIPKAHPRIVSQIIVDGSESQVKKKKLSNCNVKANLESQVLGGKGAQPDTELCASMSQIVEVYVESIIIKVWKPISRKVSTKSI